MNDEFERLDLGQFPTGGAADAEFLKEYGFDAPAPMNVSRETLPVSGAPGDADAAFMAEYGVGEPMMPKPSESILTKLWHGTEAALAIPGAAVNKVALEFPKRLGAGIANVLYPETGPTTAEAAAGYPETVTGQIPVPTPEAQAGYTEDFPVISRAQPFTEFGATIGPSIAAYGGALKGLGLAGQVGARLTGAVPETAAMVGSGVAGTAGAAMVPGMVAGAAHAGGEALRLASEEGVTDPQTLRAALEAVSQGVFAGQGAYHAVNGLGGAYRGFREGRAAKAADAAARAPMTEEQALAEREFLTPDAEASQRAAQAAEGVPEVWERPTEPEMQSRAEEQALKGVFDQRHEAMTGEFLTARDQAETRNVEPKMARMSVDELKAREKVYRRGGLNGSADLVSDEIARRLEPVGPTPTVVRRDPIAREVMDTAVGEAARPAEAMTEPPVEVPPRTEPTVVTEEPEVTTPENKPSSFPYRETKPGEEPLDLDGLGWPPEVQARLRPLEAEDIVARQETYPPGEPGHSARMGQPASGRTAFGSSDKSPNARFTKGEPIAPTPPENVADALTQSIERKKAADAQRLVEEGRPEAEAQAAAQARVEEGARLGDEVVERVQSERAAEPVPLDDINQRTIVADNQARPIEGTDVTMSDPYRAGDAVAEPARRLAPLTKALSGLTKWIGQVLGGNQTFSGLSTDADFSGVTRGNKVRLSLPTIYDRALARASRPVWVRGADGKRAQVTLEPGTPQHAARVQREIARGIVQTLAHETVHGVVEKLARTHPRLVRELQRVAKKVEQEAAQDPSLARRLSVDAAHGTDFVAAHRKVFSTLGKTIGALRANVEKAVRGGKSDIAIREMREAIDGAWRDAQHGPYEPRTDRSRKPAGGPDDGVLQSKRRGEHDAEERRPGLESDALDRVAGGGAAGGPRSAEVVPARAGRTGEPGEGTAVRGTRAEVTKNPAFRAWFGESKVVDGTGEPAVVYHGTNKDFTTFDRDTASSKTGNPNAQLGFFFTLGRAEAGRYTKDWGKEGGNVIPAHLSVKNPYEMPFKEFDDLAMAEYRGLPDATFKDGGMLDDATKARMSANRDRARNAALARRNELIAEGYDGIVVKRGKPTEEWIAFYPAQIKSAIGNRGTFDATNPDIRYARRRDDKGSTAPTFFSQLSRVAEKLPQAMSGRDLRRSPPADLAEGVVDGRRGQAETISNLLESAAFQAEGLDGLGVPERRLMVESMLAAGKDREVLDSVVKLLPVDVVDNLRRQKLTPEMLLHDESMLRRALTVDDKQPVSLVADVARAIRDGIAGVGAEVPAVSGEQGFGSSSEKLAAMETGKSSSAHLDNVAQMRESVVQEGQPLFKRRRGGQGAKPPAPPTAPTGGGKSAKPIPEPTFWDKAIEAWKGSILSGPPTFAANTAGNTAEAIVRAGETWASAFVDARLGGERTRFSGEAKAEMVGGLSRIGQHFSKLGADIKEALTLAPEKFDPNIPLERQTGAIGTRKDSTELARKAGLVARGPFRLLGATDNFYKGTGGDAELSKLTYRQAAKELGPGATEGAIRARKLKIAANPPKEILDAVEKAKQDRTYQKKSEKGEVLHDIESIRSKHKLLHFPLPFTTTPYRIAELTIQRTPYGFKSATKAYNAWKVAEKAGAPKETVLKLKGEAADAIARPLLGTALLGVFGTMAAAGALTGSGPTDRRKKSMLMSTGWQPNSLVISLGGKKHYIPVNRFEPLSSSLGFAADMVEAKDVKDGEDLLTKTWGSIMSNLGDKTYLRGVTDLAELMGDPKRYAGSYIKNLAGTVVPNIIAKSAQAIDPILRDTSGSEAGLAGLPEAAAKTIESRIPFLSKTLPARREPTGAEIERPGNAATRFLSPSQPSTEKEGVDLERVLLSIGYSPGEAGKTLTIPNSGGKTVPLSADERLVMQEAIERATEALRPMASRLAEVDPEIAKSVAEKVYESAKKVARFQIYATQSFKSKMAELRQ